MDTSRYDSAVALVGLAGRFPGARNVAEFWAGTLAGTPGLRTITDAELSAAGVTPGPGYVRVGGPVADVDRFDAAVFGFSPREAEVMEPQHRLFLECSWEALEAAGYPPTETDMPVGVFAGCGFPDYMLENSGQVAHDLAERQMFATGNERDSLTSLVSYKLGLRGPALTVQTFCSTSLVAVHLAAQSLLTFECDLALAGGVFLPLPQPAGYQYHPGGIQSPDGRARSLDAGANGTVMGSGVGVVALRRMTDALADGDVIHAVVLGSAVNNDGRDRAGYAAPGVDGQANVVLTALAVADVDPATVGYVECHAVGTPLGDSIELAALQRVFGPDRDVPCVLGTGKPAFGHLDRAAGVTGLIRATLGLRTATLPGTLGFATPNPALATDRFTVSAHSTPWPAGPQPRRAGVSSFGVGGTNAHVVLEEPPPLPARPASAGPYLLTFSAADPQTLDALGDRLGRHLAAHPELDLADVAYTLAVSRGRFPLRRAVVCRDHADAVAALADPARRLDGEATRRNPVVRLSGPPDAARDAALTRLGVRLASATGPEERALDVVVPSPGDAAGDAAGHLLGALARCWLAGAVVDWPAVSAGAVRRVELPTYPFRRDRFWLEPPRPAPAGRGPEPAPNRVRVPVWRQLPLTVSDLDARLRLAGPWLVPAGGPLARRLRLAGAEVVAADEVAVDWPDDFRALVAAIGVAPRSIVLTDDVVPGIRALGPLADRARVVVLTAGAFGVHGPDQTSPLLAGRAELARGTAAEIGCRPVVRHLDVEEGTADLDLVLAAAVEPGDDPIAVRSGRVWARGLAAAPEGAGPNRLEGAWPDPADTVLLTGGGSPAARLVAGHLARTAHCRLVLVDDGTGRRPWPADVVAALEDDGALVYELAADPAADRFGDAVRELPPPFSNLALAVHVVDDDPVERVAATFDALRDLVRAAGHGLVVHAPEPGHPGADPAAVPGAVAAALVEGARAGGAGRWSLVRAGIDDVVAGFEAAGRPGGLPVQVIEGSTGTSTAPAATPEAMPGTTAPGTTAPGTTAPGTTAPGTTAAGHRPRPALATAYVEPGTDLETLVAGRWAAELGLDRVGADDNFFELGGRSAGAVQLALALSSLAGGRLPVTAVVQYPTVRRLSAEITTLAEDHES